MLKVDMTFKLTLTFLILLLVNGACMTKESKSVDDYIDPNNNGTDYYIIIIIKLDCKCMSELTITKF